MPSGYGTLHSNNTPNRIPCSLVVVALLWSWSGLSQSPARFTCLALIPSLYSSKEHRGVRWPAHTGSTEEGPLRIQGRCDPILSQPATLLSLGLRTKQNLGGSVGKEFTLGHTQEAASGPKHQKLISCALDSVVDRCYSRGVKQEPPTVHQIRDMQRKPLSPRLTSAQGNPC